MSTHPAISDIPKKPAERRAWIAYQLRLRGASFRALARQHDYSHTAFSNVAKGLPNEAIEALLAAIIGVPAKALFPEHYRDSGERIPLARSWRRKSTPLIPQRNVYSREAS